MHIERNDAKNVSLSKYKLVLWELWWVFEQRLSINITSTSYNISVTLICVPMAVGQALYRVWVYGDVMCKLTSYLQGTIQYYIIKFNSILFNFSSKSCFMVLFSKRLFIHVHVYDFLHFCNLLLKVNAFHYIIFHYIIIFLNVQSKNVNRNKWELVIQI